MLASLIMSAAQAGISLWNEIEKQNQIEKQNKEIQQENAKRLENLEEAKIDTHEKQSIFSAINQMYNIQGANMANKMAFQTGGLLNPDVVKGIEASGLEAQRASTLADTELKIESMNSELEAKKSNITYNPLHYNLNFGNVILGGLYGYRMGEAIGKLMDLKNPNSTVDKSIKVNSDDKKASDLELDINKPQENTNQNTDMKETENKLTMSFENDSYFNSNNKGKFDTEMYEGLIFKNLFINGSSKNIDYKALMLDTH